MMRFPFACVLGLCLLAVGGCASSGKMPEKGDGSSTNGDMMPMTLCQAGQTQSCFCLSGGQGTQVCRADGMSYGQCTGCMSDGGTITIGDMQAGNPCGECDGCCNGTTCVSYSNQSNNQCGVAGTVCGQCTSGTVCDGVTGTCVMATAGCNNCGNGCCGMTSGGTPTCYVNSASNCGTNDGTCTACTLHTLCSNGACNNKLDPMATFLVTVSSSQVYNTDGMGTCLAHSYCYFGCGQPDLQVCFAYTPTGSQTAVQGCTQPLTNVPVDNGLDPSDNNATDTGMWDSNSGLLRDNNGKGQPFYIPGSYFLNGKVDVSVLDDSTCTQNVYGGEYIVADTYYSGYMIGPFSRVVNVFFSVK